jgi:L-ascorbate metabolism protein UlaG (beta-lactamase superfamily)
MRTYTRRQFLAAAAAVSAAGAGAAIAAACGGDDDPEPTPTGATSNTAAASTPTAGVDNAAVGLQWYGQAMFLLTSPGGTTVLLDPFGDIGYALPPPLNTDAATISHEHPDHNNATLGGTAMLLRGLTADGWEDIDRTIGDVRIRTVRTYHDTSQGSVLGRNAAFVVEAAGMRFAHLGDLGHVLDDEQAAALGPIDALMLPVGGAVTIDAAGATDVANQLNPKLVFPMHYKTDRTTFPLATADPFLEGKQVVRVGSTTLRIAPDTMPETQTAYVLDYE